MSFSVTTLTCLYVTAAIMLINAPVAVLAQPRPPAASTTVIERDADGIAAISKALDSMGGQAAYAAIKDTNTNATCVRASKSKTETHTVRSVTAGEYFRYDGGTPISDGLVNGPYGAMRIVSGKPSAMEGRSVRAVRPVHIPGLILYQVLNNSNDEIRMLGSTNLNGAPAVHVRIITSQESKDSFEPEEDWYFSPQTGLPLKLAYSSPAFNSVRRMGRSTVEYSNFTSTGALVLPNTIIRKLDGGPTTTCTVNSFGENTSPALSFFSVNGGGQ
jgi:hypothetical protein